MSTRNSDRYNNKRIKEYFESNLSGWWKVTPRWFIVKNKKNPSYSGPSWTGHFYSLVYLPGKGIFDKGYREEMMDAENTRKKVYIAVTLAAFLIVFGALGYLANRVHSTPHPSSLNPP